MLKSLKTRPNHESSFKSSEQTDDLSVNFGTINLKNDEKEKEKILFTNKNIKISQDEEDSDDDLIPYDTSNDLPLSTNKQPAYLRDCLDGIKLIVYKR